MCRPKLPFEEPDDGGSLPAFPRIDVVDAGLSQPRAQPMRCVAQVVHDWCPRVNRAGARPAPPCQGRRRCPPSVQGPRLVQLRASRYNAIPASTGVRRLPRGLRLFGFVLERRHRRRRDRRTLISGLHGLALARRGNTLGLPRRPRRLPLPPRSRALRVHSGDRCRGTPGKSQQGADREPHWPRALGGRTWGVRLARLPRMVRMDLWGTVINAARKARYASHLPRCRPRAQLYPGGRAARCVAVHAEPHDPRA